MSPAAFLIDGVQNNRTAPDWLFAHEKRQEKRQWEEAKVSVAEDEKIFLAAVRRRRRALHDLRKFERVPLGQLRAQFFRQIAHRIERIDAAAVHPFGDLFDAERRGNDLA